MKKGYAGRVALLTLLVSIGCFSFSSLANDDEEILKLFNETARSLPAGSAEKAPSREETLSAELKARQKENKQLQRRIAQLEALRAQEKATEQPSRPADETERLIEKLEAEIRTNKQTIASQEEALRAAAKGSGQQTDAKVADLNQQLQSVKKQLAQLQQEKQGATAQLSQQLAERQKALQDLQTKLNATEKQLAQEKQGADAKETLPRSAEQAQLQSQLTALQQQYQQSQQEYKKQRQRADNLDKELTQLNNLINSGKALAQDVSKAVQPASSTPSVPQTEAERDSYALGQFLAANLDAQIKIIKDAGITILSDPLNAGLTTKLSNGQSAIGNKEMEARYRKLDEKVNQGMNRLIAKGYERLREKTGNRKALKESEGMTWFTVKPVKSRLKANAVAAVTVKMTTLEGKTINAFSDEQVVFDQNLSPLLYEALSLTGKNGEIEGWALAQDIFEREPLPGWVAPYEVVHYQLSVK